MKKFISMVMAAAMVVTMVPATAFAAGDVTATAKVIDAAEMEIGDAVVFDGADGPEVQLTITNAEYQKSYANLPSVDVTLKLDDAAFNVAENALPGLVRVKDADGNGVKGTLTAGTAANTTYVQVSSSSDRTGWAKVNENGDIVVSTYITNAAATAAYPATAAMSGATYVAYLVENGYKLDGNTSAYVNNETGDVVTGTEVITGVPAQTTGDQARAAGYVAVKATDNAATPDSWSGAGENRIDVKAVYDDSDKDEVKFTFTGFFEKGDVISIDLKTVLDHTTEGTTATVTVDSDLLAEDAELVFATIMGKVLKASIDDVVEVAEEEMVALDVDGLEIEAAVGSLPETVTLKLSKGFEFVNKGAVAGATVTLEDEDEIEITNVTGSKIVVTGISVEATTAKSGDVATIKVVAPKWASASVEVVKVIDYTVVMSVDEDEDVPVIYSGVNVANFGLNDDSDHISLEVTIEETFAGAWDMDKSWTLSLPEGVYVTDVNVLKQEGLIADASAKFEAAYIKGDHVEFDFVKRAFFETDATYRNVKNKVVFTLELIADPGFVGDVVLTLEGAALDTQEVTVAKFIAPMTVKAEQNDVIIDYRYTEIPTEIVVTEAEAGLWDEGLVIGFEVEKDDYIVFEDDATFTVNEASDMEVEEYNYTDGAAFEVTEESEEEAAVVTIGGIELFMDRTIPAGPYALDMYCNAVGAYDEEVLFGQADYACEHGDEVADCDTVADVNDYSTTVKEAWVNVVTAGRDQDDASFTTEVVVPVGESYIVAGETQIALDVPAYINANGYTMLPVRAVATALGINNDAVQWDQATKTVIIMYGQRIITMTAGSSVVYVSGTAIPAKSAVEIVDGRAFLGLRDLATTLGVAKIAWDPATNVATLNPKA